MAWRGRVWLAASWRVILIGALATWVGCYLSYAGRLNLYPATELGDAEAQGPRALTDAEIARALQIASKVAADFDMRAWSYPIGHRPAGEDSQIVAFYQSASEWFRWPQGSRRKVILRGKVWVFVILWDDHSKLEFLIRDLSHCREAEFTREFKEALRRDLAAHFGSERITFEQQTNVMGLAP